MVVGGEPDDVEPLAFEDEAEKSVGALRLTQDDLHPLLEIHGVAVPSVRSEPRSYAGSTRISAGRMVVTQEAYRDRRPSLLRPLSP
jgi:hypothetical protein